MHSIASCVHIQHTGKPLRDPRVQIVYTLNDVLQFTRIRWPGITPEISIGLMKISVKLRFRVSTLWFVNSNSWLLFFFIRYHVWSWVNYKSVSMQSFPRRPHCAIGNAMVPKNIFHFSQPALLCRRLNRRISCLGKG